MQPIYDEILKYTISAVMVIIGSLGSMALVQLQKWLSGLKTKDHLGIINTVTDAAAIYAEHELSGLKGMEKREKAIDYALRVLASKGIVASRDEVLAGIEDGVNKLKIRGMELKSGDPDPKIGLSE